MESSRGYRRYSKLSTEMKPTCQKIEYHAKPCNIDPRKKGFRKTLPSLERPIHVLAQRELNEKLRIEEEEEEERGHRLLLLQNR